MKYCDSQQIVTGICVQKLQCLFHNQNDLFLRIKPSVNFFAGCRADTYAIPSENYTIRQILRVIFFDLLIKNIIIYFTNVCWRF